MAGTVEFTLVSVCSGGGHFVIGVSVNGGPQRDFVYEVDDVLAGPGQIDDASDMILVLLRLHFAGMTRVQTRAALMAGVTITI